MIRLAAKLAGFLKTEQVCLAFASVQALGETAANLLQPWRLKIVLDNLFSTTLSSQPSPPWPMRSPTGALRGSRFSFCELCWRSPSLRRSHSTLRTCLPRSDHWVLRDLQRKLY